MKYKKITLLSSVALSQSIATQTENLRRLRFAHSISPIENPMKIQRTKKIIAQLKTMQRAQELKLVRKNNHAEKS